MSDCCKNDALYTRPAVLYYIYYIHGSATVSYTHSLTFFAHACAEALAKSAVAALVSLVLVDDAAALKAARIDVTFTDGAPEEALTSVARRRAVVLAGRPVVADGARGGLGAGRRTGWRRSRGHVEVRAAAAAAGWGWVVEGCNDAGAWVQVVTRLQNAATNAACSQVHVTDVCSICMMHSKHELDTSLFFDSIQSDPSPPHRSGQTRPIVQNEDWVSRALDVYADLTRRTVRGRKLPPKNGAAASRIQNMQRFLFSYSPGASTVWPPKSNHFYVWPRLTFPENFSQIACSFLCNPANKQTNRHANKRRLSHNHVLGTGN